MKHYTKMWLLLLGPALLLTAEAASFGGEEVQLEEARVFIEFNSTDNDIGIQFFWDGDAWAKMRVEDPDGKAILRVKASNSLGDQGLTEGFFESDEPTADELSMEEFFERFPEGEYEFEGTTLEGDELEGEAEFSHTLPAAPANLYPAQGTLIDAREPLVASFDAVTTDLEGQPLTPDLYHVVIEEDDDHFFEVVLPGGAAQPAVTVPAEFLTAGTEYKLEVIAQEEGGNRTISETSFATR
jgi:hypothetical protein